MSVCGKDKSNIGFQLVSSATGYREEITVASAWGYRDHCNY